MRPHRLLVLFALVLVALVLVALAALPVRMAGAEGVVEYRPPVRGPVVDPFRPPPEPWAAGNRGVDYATRPGAAVGAAADGQVVFAGQVGGRLHVVVLHADGIRTSYSFLAQVLVHRGDLVVQGQPVGTSEGRFHFGARRGDIYIDPLSLFTTGPPRVHLVPDTRPSSPRSPPAARALSPPTRAFPTAAGHDDRLLVDRVWRWALHLM